MADEGNQTNDQTPPEPAGLSEEERESDNRTAWIVAGIVILIILGLLGFGIITLFNRLFPGPAPTPTSTPLATPTPLLSPTPTSSSTPSPTLTPTPTSTPVPTLTPTPTPTPPARPTSLSTKVLAGPGFTLSYPAIWGLLTCSNSQNFEFDPGGPDRAGVICSFAQEPITVLVANDLSNCSGETVNIGGVTVVRSTTVTADFVSRQWCTETSPVLKITNRVSATGFPATSPIDYSPEIETMIVTLRFATA